MILAPQQHYSVGEQMRRILRMSGERSPEDMQGRAEFLSRWSEAGPNQPRRPSRPAGQPPGTLCQRTSLQKSSRQTQGTVDPAHSVFRARMACPASSKTKEPLRSRASDPLRRLSWHSVSGERRRGVGRGSVRNSDVLVPNTRRYRVFALGFRAAFHFDGALDVRESNVFEPLNGHFSERPALSAGRRSTCNSAGRLGCNLRPTAQGPGKLCGAGA